jgi:hypothetical protein
MLDRVKVTRQVASFDPAMQYLNVFVKDDEGKIIIEDGVPATERLIGEVEIEWDLASMGVD